MSKRTEKNIKGRIIALFAEEKELAALGRWQGEREDWRELIAAANLRGAHDGIPEDLFPLIRRVRNSITPSPAAWPDMSRETVVQEPQGAPSGSAAAEVVPSAQDGGEGAQEPQDAPPEGTRWGTLREVVDAYRRGSASCDDHADELYNDAFELRVRLPLVSNGELTGEFVALDVNADFPREGGEPDRSRVEGRFMVDPDFVPFERQDGGHYIFVDGLPDFASSLSRASVPARFLLKRDDVEVPCPTCDPEGYAAGARRLEVEETIEIVGRRG